MGTSPARVLEYAFAVGGLARVELAVEHLAT